ncbi:septal ring lytic transglycosylase RlpA family protein [Salinisphaera sp.]|uniref:septal ring lytic transglycosylase RlpA family protein n=1 Tax=Salinisphaera sp. TaxID=1914330 RepID=UPI002D78160B|nr:septal ring lytic transglycosylase RlpA family protein [Salinisphaera sp.]HET7314340.1 septal ring lytic transglycosylase RlpA family protein [Salinisphaera sp.]
MTNHPQPNPTALYTAGSRHALVFAAMLVAAVLSGCATQREPHVTRTHIPAPVSSPDENENEDGSEDTTAESHPSIYERGNASYYAASFNGQTTASGEPYDPHALTAAHRTLPLGSRVRVVNLENDKHVTVRINDRGPFVDGRVIDLSKAAAKKLDMRHDGVVPVTLQIVSKPK